MALKETSVNQKHNIPSMIDGAVSSYLAHLCFIPQHLRTHAPWKWGFDLAEKNLNTPIDFTQPHGIDYFLAKHLRYYKPDYREKIKAQKRHNQLPWVLDGANIKLIKKRLRHKDIIGAWEGFMATANAEWRESNHPLYQSAGGDARPFLATLYTMSVDGAYHVIHPLSLIWWSMGAYLIDSTHVPELLLKLTGAWTIAFGLIGLPIAVKKAMLAQKQPPE